MGNVLPTSCYHVKRSHHDPPAALARACVLVLEPPTR
jgi:hypothetical protein